MRLVIDLQGAQGSSRHRGIGRFSRELALAMARDPGPHEPIILVNDVMPEAASSLSEEFSCLLPRSSIRSFRGLAGSAYRGSGMGRRHLTELIRASAIDGLQADLVHISSMMEGLGDDVVTSWPSSLRRVPLVSTFYDAIPLIHASEYLTDQTEIRWYHRHLHELVQCAGLLSISDSSSTEAVKYLGRHPADVFNISAGFDTAMFCPIVIGESERARFLDRYGVRDGFVLYVGAGDRRKNADGLLRAYAQLPRALRAKHQLVIVGREPRESLMAAAIALEVSPADFLLLDYVPESDLSSLYSLCRCFVMPSKHEGFGLPALEAMACGAPVIASRNTSLPEVIGLEDALFDPYDPADIASHLQRTLTDDGFRELLIRHGLDRAARFSWTATAKMAWQALEEINRRQAPGRTSTHSSIATRKETLAFVGPLLPDRSGISTYSACLLPSLAEHYDITVVTRSGDASDPALNAVFPVIDEESFLRGASGFDRIVYQVGNSEFHIGEVERLLPRHPGVVVLHDAFLSNLGLYDALTTGQAGHMARLLFESHGWQAVDVLAREGIQQAAIQFPCLWTVLCHALGIMVHSKHARDIVCRELGDSSESMVRVIPFVRVTRRPPQRPAARHALNIELDAPLVCTFGIVDPIKRPMDVFEAWLHAFRGDPAARLAFVGPVAQDLAHAIAGRAAECGAAGRVIITGRVDEAAYWSWVAAADIAVQLRRMSRGETSGAIADCMAVGLPVVVTAHGAAAELPAEAVALLPDLANANEIGETLASLWGDSNWRERLSAGALAHVRAAWAPVRAAAGHREAIEHFYAQRTAFQLSTPQRLSAGDYVEAARALAGSFELRSPQRLLISISTVCEDDVGTGIRRVIHEIGSRVLRAPETGVADIVRLDGSKLRYARSFAAGMLGLPDYGFPEPPVRMRAGDILVLMDNHCGVSAAELEELRQQWRYGARVIVVIYDVPPMPWPEWFPQDGAGQSKAWLREILRIADGALCISKSVADELRECFENSARAGHPIRRRPIDIGWFHLGSDFTASPKHDNREGGELRRAETGSLPPAGDMPVASWDESAAAFLAAVRAPSWPMCWAPPAACSGRPHHQS